MIGVGVKQSTSDLLIANCDEFIFYDDLVRESQRNAARRDNRDTQQPRRTPRKNNAAAPRWMRAAPRPSRWPWKPTKPWSPTAMWAARSGPRCSKEAIKRRNPGFNENYYGFRTFGNLLEEAQNRGLLEFGRDENRAPSSHAATACHGQRLRPQAPQVLRPPPGRC